MTGPIRQAGGIEIRLPGRWAPQGLGLWLVGAFILAVMINIVGITVDWEQERDGSDLLEVLWAPNNRTSTIVVSVLAGLLLIGLVAMIWRTPRRSARRTVVVDDTGLGFYEYRRWWRPGRQRVLPWQEVQAISASGAIFRESAGKYSTNRSRPILDIFLYRDVDGLPDYAATVPEASPTLEGVRTPAHRIRIGAGGEAYDRVVREIADAIGRTRPDVFYRGIAVDQWYTPPGSAPAERAEPDPGPGATPGLAPDSAPEPSVRRHASGVRDAEPVTIEKSSTLPGALGFIAVSAVVCAVSYAALVNPFPSPWQVIVGWLGVVPFLLTAIVLPVSIVLLPRTVATRMVRIDGAGLEFVQGTMWWYRRGVQITIPWDAVQAIVARSPGATVGPAGTRIKGSIIDIYLHGVDWPTKFLQEVTPSRHDEPDSAGTAALAAFPATRLRVLFRRVSPTFQAALYAHRPDLCHGFDDVEPADGRASVTA